MTVVHLPHDHGQNALHIIQHTPTEQEFQTVADSFHMLGDASRMKIFWILCHCEECVINLSAMMEMSSPAVAHHLKLLKAAELVTSRRHGKEVYYKVSGTSQAVMLHDMLEKLMVITCPGEKE